MITLTCRDRTDGIGAQVCGIISVMVLAESLNFNYVYTPIVHVAHYPYDNPSDRELRIWKNKWEDMFNLKTPYKLLEEAQGIREFIDYRKLPGFFSTNSNNKHSLNSIVHSLQRPIPMVYGMREAHNILSKYQSYPQLESGWSKVLNNIRNKYNRSKKDTPHFKTSCDCCNKNIKNIAIHIRRGDSVNTQRRFVQHEYFKNTLDSIIYTIDSSLKHLYHIHIYSEGKIEDFPEFTSFDNCFFHLDTDHFDTVHHFICADIFIMSKSTFSYLGALYNNIGKIIYKPFWLLPPKPLEKEWVINNNEKGFLEETQIKSILNNNIKND